MFGLFKKKENKKPSREDLLKQAKANAAQAREAIGEETLEKVREHLIKKENSPFEKARQKVASMDQERVADNIRAEMRDD